MIKLPTALALIGPTASGKTALALSLAEQIPLEIISMDSALVYQNMDIGTAKPTQQERLRVVHHLLDVVSPLENYSAAQFAEAATRLIIDIRARHKLPLIVGGTMLYFRALKEGLNPLPSADAATRQRIGCLKETEGLAGLYARLQEIDSATASRLSPTDSQRIERALEIAWVSGRTMSDWLNAPRANPTVNIRSFALLPEPRSQLHQHIGARFEKMIAEGLIDEIRHLQQQYPTLTADLPSMRCVGYRQAWAHLAGEINHAQMMEQGIVATRQLAKRQLTWLRNMPLDLVHNPYQNQKSLPSALIQAASDCLCDN